MHFRVQTFHFGYASLNARRPPYSALILAVGLQPRPLLSGAWQFTRTGARPLPK